MENINQISGIKLHYARETQYPYGSQGRPITFSIESGFKNQLTQCFDELFSNCPLGKPNIITCAGIYTPSNSNSSSQHIFGKAFDIDAAFWNNRVLITKKFLHNKDLYLGMESYLRLHFGIVLNYFYNTQHQDHWHIDNSVSVDFRTSARSSTVYLQLVLTYIYENPVEIDGFWGPQTRNAIRNVLGMLGLSGEITSVNTYKAFLRKTGTIAFKRFEHTQSPLALLNNVYDSIDNLDIGSGNRLHILEALNDFRNNTKTDTWLLENEVAVDLEDLIDGLV